MACYCQWPTYFAGEYPSALLGNITDALDKHPDQTEKALKMKAADAIIIDSPVYIQVDGKQVIVDGVVLFTMAGQAGGARAYIFLG